MSEKNYTISVLLDFYGVLLGEKQREAVDLYYNEDLSLSEIAEHSGISRQGVRDQIKHGETQLLELESKLKLAEKHDTLSMKIEELVAAAESGNREKAEKTAEFIKELYQ